MKSENIPTQEEFENEKRRSDGTIIPAGFWTYTAFGKVLSRSLHPFLQGFLGKGCIINMPWDELTLHMEHSMLWVKVFDNYIDLAYISTNEDRRFIGSGKRALQSLIKIADNTNSELRLTTDVVRKLKMSKTYIQR
jgi:hypothetical protein